MKKLLLIISVVFVVGLAMLFFYLPQPEPSVTSSPAKPADKQLHTAPAAPVSNPTTADAKPTSDLPKYMRDTTVDGVFQVDGAGNLIITEDIRHIFDYFLSTVGPESVEVSLKRLRQYIDSQLQDPARSQAHEILNQYLQYQSELIALEIDYPQGTDLNGLIQREAAVKALRERIFSSEIVAAFFGSEQIYNAFTLQRLSIIHDPSLSDDVKNQRIQALRDALPEDMQENALSQLLTELNQKTAELQANGGSPEDLRKLRQQTVGVEATVRLEQLDTTRAEWYKRLLTFKEQRQKINDNTGLSDAEKAQEIARLQEQNFSETERLRIDPALQLYEMEQQQAKQQ